MKKLKLSELNLGSAEVLTREQLKKVSGGGTLETTDPGGGGGQFCGNWGTAHCSPNYIPKMCGGSRSNYTVYCADPITGACYSFDSSSAGHFWCEG